MTITAGCLDESSKRNFSDNEIGHVKRRAKTAWSSPATADTSRKTTNAIQEIWHRILRCLDLGRDKGMYNCQTSESKNGSAVIIIDVDQGDAEIAQSAIVMERGFKKERSSEIGVKRCEIAAYSCLLPKLLSLAVVFVGSRWLASAASLPSTCQARPTSTNVANITARQLGQRDTPPQTFGSFCEGEITLKSDGTEPGVVIIDHGLNVGGLPTFQILSRSGDTSVFEMTYSETRVLLDRYMGDGPLPLAASLDTYRKNRYNITRNMTYTNRLIQGGERYQKLNLSTPGQLVLKSVGIISTVSTTPVTQLPGSFQCSDDQLNQIWQTGARTVQRTEIAARSIPEFYQISEQGLFAESQAPQPYSSDTAPGLMQYQLRFLARPTVGGFGYTVLSDTLGSGIYISVNVANSSISANSGSTEWDSPALASAILSPALGLSEWHEISTTVNSTEIYITINGKSIMNLTQTSAFAGSFGLGASFGQSSYFQNVSLKSLDGQPIYTSSLTQKSVLADFLAGTNVEPVSVDGARRDRIAYAGDLDITVGPTFASTHGSEYINGSLNLLGASQLLPGFFVPNVKIQQAPRTSIIQANQTGLIGYSFNLLTAMAEFYLMTGDVEFANHWAPAIVKMLDWADSQTTSLGLFNVSVTSFGGDWDFYDPPQTGAVTKFNTLYAFALQQVLPILNATNVSSQVYADRLVTLKAAINTNLWSSQLNAYQLSNSVKDTLAQDANALLY
ncbi:hypothetical protein G7Y89_g13386 [Cudoniella acicularis]|uniref:Alpha-L-rhamnosidase six-hairpin glycosidase domain-containing protein n=1 Tax=Cudoniella acicularis TaxID=354080 RepID=A0A8H4R8N2_9HELO|nr:hypothetical protein G7Y89_g13386 [Cudoniella acicularis]